MTSAVSSGARPADRRDGSSLARSSCHTEHASRSTARPTTATDRTFHLSLEHIVVRAHSSRLPSQLSQRETCSLILGTTVNAIGSIIEENTWTRDRKHTTRTRKRRNNRRSTLLITTQAEEGAAARTTNRRKVVERTRALAVDASIFSNRLQDWRVSHSIPSSCSYLPGIISLFVWVREIACMNTQWLPGKGG